jgi:hypothetical protein
MATRTWKIGEYCKGGIITVETTDKVIKFIGKDWDYSKGSRRSSDQSGAKEFTRKEILINDNNAYREMYDFLTDLTTHYYTTQIIDWLKTKTKVSTFAGGIHW